MATTENTDYFAWGDELQYWMNIGTKETPNIIQVTDLLSFDETSEATTYQTSHIDKKTQKTYTQSTVRSIAWEKDTVRGGILEAWAIKNRNKTDVFCEIVKVYTWDGESGAKKADKATFMFTPNPIKNSNVGQPVVLGGTCNMDDENWTEGAWDKETKAFTAAGETPVDPEETPEEG